MAKLGQDHSLVRILIFVPFKYSRFKTFEYNRCAIICMCKITDTIPALSDYLVDMVSAISFAAVFLTQVSDHLCATF